MRMSLMLSSITTFLFPTMKEKNDQDTKGSTVLQDAT